MLKKTIKYRDFAGNEVEEDFYFNLTRTEAVRWQLKYEGGLEAYVDRLNIEERPAEIMELFESLLLSAYGQKSNDNRHFLKSEEMTQLFAQSAAYDELFSSMMQNTELAIAFFNELLSEYKPVVSQ